MMLHKIYELLDKVPRGEDRLVGDFCIDTRILTPGGVFLAVAGCVVDGHDYIDQALEKGASLIIGSRRLEGVINHYICVENVQQALFTLAKYWRSLYLGRVIAITGTVGKTSIKELVVSVLQTVAKVSYSKGNYNTQWGVPISLLNSSVDADWLVVEVGARYPGDVALLVDLLKPDAGIVTQVGIGHTLNMKDENGVSECKYEMIATLQPHALAMVRLYDEKRFGWDTRNPVILLGRDAKLENVVVNWMSSCAEVCLSFVDCMGHLVDERWPVLIKQTGKIVLDNALLVASLMRYYQIPIENITSALLDYLPVSGRGDIFLLGECWIINDSYNANPTSMHAAIDSLMCAPGPRGVYLGDMLDLGMDEKKYHNELMQKLDQDDVAVVCLKGPLMMDASHMLHQNVCCNPDVEQLKNIIISYGLKSLLVKGSNGMGLHNIVNQIKKYRDSI